MWCPLNARVCAFQMEASELSCAACAFLDLVSVCCSWFWVQLHCRLLCVWWITAASLESGLFVRVGVGEVLKGFSPVVGQRWHLFDLGGHVACVARLESSRVEDRCPAGI